MKEIKKISLSNITNKLSRNEMRAIMAGSYSGTESCPTVNCRFHSECGNCYCRNVNAGNGACGPGPL